MPQYPDPNENYYEPTPGIEPNVAQTAYNARVNPNWLDGLVEGNGATRPFTHEAIEAAVLAYDDPDDAWDDLFGARLKEYFQENPTCFWCRMCKRGVPLDDLVEVLAGFLEHDGHSIESDPR